MGSIKEKLMHAVDSVSSVDKADVEKRLFPRFCRESPKRVYKKLYHSL